MTRVNAGILPEELVDQHLLAEYREILRCIKTGTNGYGKYGESFLKRIPEEFTLNKGHVLFFSNKLEYIVDRFESLKRELVERGYEVKMTYDKRMPHEGPLWGDYSPTQSARDLLIERIIIRFPKKATYYGSPISLTEYTEEVLRCYPVIN